ncbi:hypothetical protein FQR65_LT07327 [Abscondita terminalis]|nr:hypothetical protein FQR65_LT07327 [Abscondita terminalis]
MTSENRKYFLCAFLLVSSTTCTANEENDKENNDKVNHKRSAFNDYYYDADDTKLYGSGYGGQFGGYIPESTKNFKIGTNTDSYDRGSSSLGNKEYFSRYGTGGKSLSTINYFDGLGNNQYNYRHRENDLKYIYNGQKIYKTERRYESPEGYNQNFNKLNGIYADRFGLYTNDGSLKNTELNYNTKIHTHSHHTITKEISVAQPYPVTVTKHIPVHIPQPYPVEVSKPVAVPVQIPVEVPKPYPVTITQKVPYVVEKPVYVTKNVPVEVPKPYPVHITQHVPIEVKVPVEVPKPYPITVKEPVPYPVQKKVYVTLPRFGGGVKNIGSFSDSDVSHRIEGGTSFLNSYSNNGGNCINYDSGTLEKYFNGIGNVNHGRTGLGYDHGLQSVGHQRINSHSNVNSGPPQTFLGTSGTYSGVYVPSSQGGLHGSGYNTYRKNWSW